MALQLGAFVALAKDPVLVSTQWFTIICNSNFKVSGAFSGLHGYQAHMKYPSIHTSKTFIHKQKQFKKKKLDMVGYCDLCCGTISVHCKNILLSLKKQHGKFTDRVNEPQGSTQMTGSGLSCKSWLKTCLSYLPSSYN